MYKRNQFLSENIFFLLSCLLMPRQMLHLQNNICQTDFHQIKYILRATITAYKILEMQVVLCIKHQQNLKRLKVFYKRSNDSLCLFSIFVSIFRRFLGKLMRDVATLQSQQLSQSAITELRSWQLIWVHKSPWFGSLAVEIEFIMTKFICGKISLIRNEIKA